MALRNQPYIPLYVQDFLTDEKLNECSSETTGVYIKIMCVMHKSKEYGTILLKQKDKQTTNQIKNFALKLNNHISFDTETIQNAIIELLDEEVLYIEQDSLCQKRMIKDNDISVKRSKAGKKGGFASKVAQANNEAKDQANSETENETENETDIAFIDSSFNDFWDLYHEITMLPQTDRESAKKKWKSLKKSEREKATEMIRDYFDSLSDKKYCKKARTYLGDKNFNDELKSAEQIKKDNWEKQKLEFLNG